MQNYDVIIIGGGVTGCAVARAMSRYAASVLLLERGEDVCSGTSKANSAIVHAGFDAKPGTMMARMNVAGSQMMPALARVLDIPYRQNGSLVLCFDESDRPGLEALLERGRANGVEGLRIVERDELVQMEPNVGDAAVAALYAPTGAIVCPFELTIALAESAAANGAEFRFDREVTGLAREDGGWRVTAGGEDFFARCVVNAAGVYADAIHNLTGAKPLTIAPRKGDYVLLDKTAGGHVRHTIFQLPGPYGKGVLVTPTVHGNLLIGPTATDIDDKEGVATTAAELADVQRKSAMSVKDIPYNQAITSFSGLRAHEAGHDFILGEVSGAPGFFDAAGIESPGLSSAPAIGEYLAGLVAARLGAAEKADFIPTRRGIPHVAALPAEERQALIAQNPLYGRIVCRCEQVSEGEIVDAIRRPVGARSMDGVKRRVRAGMGRCQAGFCTPRVMEILARELGIPVTAVRKNGPGSELVVGVMGEDEA